MLWDKPLGFIHIVFLSTCCFKYKKGISSDRVSTIRISVYWNVPVALIKVFI